MTAERTKEVEVSLKRGACPYCKDEVRPSDEKVACDGCMAWHHRECWAGHGACSACGFDLPSGLDPAPRALQTPPPVCAHPECEQAPLTKNDYRRVLAYRGGDRCRRHSLEHMRPRALVFSLLFGLGLGLAVALSAFALVSRESELLPLAFLALLFGVFWSVGAIGGVLEVRRLGALPEPAEEASSKAKGA